MTHEETEVHSQELRKSDLAGVGVQRLAAIRAWTGDVCYVITTLLYRDYIGENNLDDFLVFPNLVLYFWGFWGLYYSKMAN